MSDESTIGREPITIVEIDQDFCSRTYGVSPCVAQINVTGTDKCYNSFKTCQDTDNYDLTSLTLRFSTAVEDAPRDVVLIPTVLGVTTNPTTINVGGSDANSGLLGRRASITVDLRDHPYHDRLVDKYVTERSFDPSESGTFWSKWLSRNPFYLGRPIRVRSGYVGQALAAMQVRNYVIERIEGPTNGRVRIIAKDVLKLADDDRALAPAPNSGKLAADITSAESTLTLTPSGVGDLEYSASGVGRLGSELFLFTRVGDVFTLTSRGERDTDTSDHREGDILQEVLVVDAQTPDVVMNDLLVNFAGVDPAFVPLADWQTELTLWLQGFELSIWLTEPTGVATLIGEILDQTTAYIWWDDIDQEIKLRVLRPFFEQLDGTITMLNDDSNFIAGSTRIRRRPTERISQVWVYYDQINPTAGKTDPTNFRRLRVRVDNSAESANEFDETRVRTIFARWLTDLNDPATLVLTTRKLNRDRDVPIVFEAALDAKDRTLRAGEVADVTHSGFVDFTGQQEVRRMQVVSVEEREPGHRVEYQMRPFEFTRRYGFILPNTAVDYFSTPEADREVGCWIAPGSTGFANGDRPYSII